MPVFTVRVHTGASDRFVEGYRVSAHYADWRLYCAHLSTAVVLNVQEVALAMIHTIREAFNELLAENHWMDDETRAVAKEKADAMNERIGYPELLTEPDELNKEYIMVSVRVVYRQQQ